MSGNNNAEEWRMIPPGLSKKDFLRRPEMKKIKNSLASSYGLTYFCVVATLILTVWIGGALEALIDVAIMLACGLFIHLKQSRAAAIVLLCYAVYNVIATIVLMGMPTGWLIVVAGIVGVIYTFRFQKIWAEYSQYGAGYTNAFTQNAFPQNGYAPNGVATGAEDRNRQWSGSYHYGQADPANSSYNTDPAAQNPNAYNYGQPIPGPGGFMPDGAGQMPNSQPQKKGRGIWIVLAILILAAVIGMIYAAVAADDGSDTPGSVEKKIVEEFTEEEETPKKTVGEKTEKDSSKKEDSGSGQNTLPKKSGKKTISG